MKKIEIRFDGNDQCLGYELFEDDNFNNIIIEAEEHETGREICERFLVDHGYTRPSDLSDFYVSLFVVSGWGIRPACWDTPA